jgi:DtxR family Mn-dependent transcriptional regulator
MSVATENFLKTVYQLSMIPGNSAKPGIVAQVLDITNAAATDMARNLSEKGLIQYRKYKEIKLTEAGRKEALWVIRKHRLWETFLHQVLNINLGEIHREAELLEHQTSDFLAGKINEYLGNPEFDPHGDPIPNQRGEVKIEKSFIPVFQAKEGKEYIIKRLYSSDDVFFEFCETNNLIINTTVVIEKQYPKQGMTSIKKGKTKIILNKDFTKRIYVKQKS